MFWLSAPLSVTSNWKNESGAAMFAPQPMLVTAPVSVTVKPYVPCWPLALPLTTT
jgi:hypothetical protein